MIRLVVIALALAIPSATALAADNAPAAQSAPLLTVKAPCPGPECDSQPPEPHAQGLRIVYLNFEGVTLTSSNTSDDATTNTSAILSGKIPPGSTKVIPPFSASDLVSTQGLTRQQIIQYTVQQMYESHQDFNIEFVTQRPSSGHYHMVVFGGSCFSVAGEDSCGGIAPRDCGDFMPSNVVFVFPKTGNGLRVGDLAATASQELAHAFGLMHTEDYDDIMYPYIRDIIPTEYGAGDIPQKDLDGACNGATYQDSHAKLMSTIGFRGQDTIPPKVTITEPSNNELVTVGDAVRATIEDENPIVQARLLVDNREVEKKSAPPWNFTVPPGTELGRVFIEVEATDTSDNTAGHRVSVLLGNGDEEPCDNGKCQPGYDCQEGLCYSSDGGSLGELGQVCTGNGQCDTGLCASSGEEQRCSQTCDADTVCPPGFHCIANTACWPDETNDDDGGDEGGLCSVSEGGSTGALASFGLLCIALLCGGRRRQS
jgi:hypothetical protein